MQTTRSCPHCHHSQTISPFSTIRDSKILQKHQISTCFRCCQPKCNKLVHICTASECSRVFPNPENSITHYNNHVVSEIDTIKLENTCGFCAEPIITTSHLMQCVKWQQLPSKQKARAITIEARMQLYSISNSTQSNSIETNEIMPEFGGFNLTKSVEVEKTNPMQQLRLETLQTPNNSTPILQTVNSIQQELHFTMPTLNKTSQNFVEHILRWRTSEAEMDDFLQKVLSNSDISFASHTDIKRVLVNMNPITPIKIIKPELQNKVIIFNILSYLHYFLSIPTFAEYFHYEFEANPLITQTWHTTKFQQFAIEAAKQNALPIVVTINHDDFRRFMFSGKSCGASFLLFENFPHFLKKRKEFCRVLSLNDDSVHFVAEVLPMILEQFQIFQEQVYEIYNAAKQKRERYKLFLFAYLADTPERSLITFSSFLSKFYCSVCLAHRKDILAPSTKYAMRCINEAQKYYQSLLKYEGETLHNQLKSTFRSTGYDFRNTKTYYQQQKRWKKQLGERKKKKPKIQYTLHTNPFLEYQLFNFDVFQDSNISLFHCLLLNLAPIVVGAMEENMSVENKDKLTKEIYKHKHRFPKLQSITEVVTSKDADCVWHFMVVAPFSILEFLSKEWQEIFESFTKFLEDALCPYLYQDKPLQGRVLYEEFFSKFYEGHIKTDITLYEKVVSLHHPIHIDELRKIRGPTPIHWERVVEIKNGAIKEYNISGIHGIEVMARYDNDYLCSQKQFGAKWLSLPEYNNGCIVCYQKESSIFYGKILEKLQNNVVKIKPIHLDPICICGSVYKYYESTYTLEISIETILYECFYIGNKLSKMYF